MADNSLQGGTDSIRDIDRSGIGPKTQVFQLDHAGAGSSESLTSTTNPLPAYKPNRSATGNLTALNSAVSLVLSGDGDVSMDIVVTALVGTIIFEQRLPTGTWYSTNATVSATSGPTPSYVNPASGLYRLSSGGTGEVRVRVSAFTSGSAVVIVGSSASSNAIYANQILPTKLFDGTNTATIKAASTAAVAADPSLVVALHPTSPLPAFAAIPAFKTDLTTPGTTNSIAVSTIGTTAISAFPAGFQRTSDEPRQIFYDPFDAALDTTNRWSAPTSAGGGVAASVTTGTMALGSGTTINGYSYLTSQASFTPTVPAWLGNSWAILIESGATAGNNAVRFWGHGIVGGTPSSTNPLGATGNGYGFELDTAGVLQAVVYAGGTRTAVASLAALQPTDGAYHRYICYYRTDKIYWYIDGLGSTQLAATSNFQAPQVQSLPLLALAVAHSSAPAASRVISCTGLAVWDTGKNNTTISDGTYGWRKATVSATGALSVNAVQSGTWNVGSITTLPALATGGNVIGALTANQSVNAAQINGVAPLMGTGISGTGALRVTLATDIALPTGANTIGALTANQSVNNAQIGGIAPLMGNGVTGTGSQRVTIASNNTAFPVVATQLVGASATSDTGAKTVTGNGAQQTNSGSKGVQILLRLGTVTGTTPTMVLKAQGSVDSGSTWYDIPGATTASLTTTGNYGILIYPGLAVTAGTTTSGTTAAASMAIPGSWRVVWTIGGTTPSFTITDIQYNYPPN